MTPQPLATIDRRIADLRSLLEQTAQNLVELDGDVTRQTLDASLSLTGKTAEAWSRAQQQISDLWRGQLALVDLLERLGGERGSRSSVSRPTIDRLTTLLDGASVSLARSGADAVHRSLTDGPVPTLDYTIDETVTRMSRDYDSVVDLVTTICAVWTETLPQLTALEATLTALDAEITITGGRRPNEFATARRAIAEAQASACNDPLSMSTQAVSAIAAIVERTRTFVREAKASRRELVGDLTAVTAALDEAHRVVQGARTQCESDAAKIVIADAAWRALDQADSDIAELRHMLDAANRMAETSPSEAGRLARDLRQRGTRLRDEANRLQGRYGSDLATRDELRGRLDAYRAKARSVGRAEDLNLERLHREAKDLLYSAPCDLVQAHAAVTAYQRAIRSGATGAA